MLLIGCLAILLVALNYMIKRSITAPGVIFNIMWGFVLICQGLNPYGMYEVSGKTIGLVAVGMVAFNVCLIITDSLKIKVRAHGTSKKAKTVVDCTISRLACNVISIMLLMLLLILFIRILPYYYIYSGNVIREVYASGFFPDGREFMTTIERLLYIHFGVFPATYAFANFMVVLWFMGKINFKMLIIPTINVAIVGFLSGGRYILFYLFILLFFGKQLISQRKLTKKQKRKIKKVVFFISVLVVAYLIFNTVFRNSGKFTAVEYLIRTIVVYFSGGLTMLDLTLTDRVGYSLVDFTYGLSSFAGLLSILYYITYFISFKRFTIGVTSSFVQAYLNKTVLIGPSVLYNAFPTMYYYGYRDFGVIGVILLPSILAFFAALYYKRVKCTRDAQSISIYLEILFIIIMSVCWWEPHRTEFWARMIWLIVFYQYLAHRKNRSVEKV